MTAYVRQGVLVVAAAAVGGASAVALGRAGVGSTSRTTTVRRVAAVHAPINVSSTTSGLNAAHIYRRDAAGVVVVNATSVHKVSDPLDPFAPSQRERTRALGSGFVIDRRGHILTNAHVVAGARTGEFDLR